MSNGHYTILEAMHRRTINCPKPGPVCPTVNIHYQWLKKRRTINCPTPGPVFPTVIIQYQWLYTEELLIVPRQDLYFQRSLYNISGHAQKNYLLSQARTCISSGHYTILVAIHRRTINCPKPGSVCPTVIIQYQWLFTEELLIVPRQDLYVQRSLYNISGHAQKNY